MPKSVAVTLTPRQIEVAKLVAEGLSTARIARKLKLSVKTVERHRHDLFRRLRLKNSVELTRYAIQAGVSKLSGVHLDSECYAEGA